MKSLIASYSATYQPKNFQSVTNAFAWHILHVVWVKLQAEME